jgi:hypothetical protein
MSTVREPEQKHLIEQAQASLLEVIDHVLNQGVVITGDVVLGVANIDLVYLGLSVLLCAADRISPRNPKE